MKIGKIGARRYLGTAAAATLICLLSALCSGASSTLGGIVLTGGALTLDFADPANNHSPNVIDRLDVMTWSGGSGALAGQNLVFAGPPQSTDECTEPVSSFGQISLLYPGELAAFANRHCSDHDQHYNGRELLIFLSAQSGLFDDHGLHYLSGR